MKLTIKHELDAIYETMGLMYLSYHPEEWARDKYLKTLAEEGISIRVYDKISPILSKYINTFEEKMIKSEYDMFFFEDSIEDLLAHLMGIMIHHRDWLQNIHNLEEEVIFKNITQMLYETTPSNTGDIITLLQEEELDPHISWKWLLIFQRPKHYIGLLVDIVNSNLLAYQEAFHAVKSNITPLLANFKEPPARFHEQFNLFIGEKSVFYPVLCLPISHIIWNYGFVYCGLFLNQGLDELIQNEVKSNAYVAASLKLLGDPSKFEILTLLKEGPKYGLEVAKTLDISPATASHHMNSLLNKGFVTVEKREGKVYFALKKDQIHELIIDIERILL